LSWLARDNPVPALDTRGASVLYAPDWGGAAWVETLAQWSRAFRPDDPVTLVLKPPVTDRARLLAHMDERLRAAGVDPERMPDVLVAGIEPREIHGMVAGADAVLVDGEVDRPLWRRARRLVRADADVLRALRAELIG